ncbi:MAG: alpha/beta fold hydrolase [Hyphomicrobium sp.]
MKLLENCLQTGPQDAACHLLLAHGAGAPMSSPFLDRMAALLADRGIAVTRFEFAYMAARRTGGKKRPPPKAEALTSEFRDVLAAFADAMPGAGVPFIGGKSLGGRVASMIADEAVATKRARGLVCLGYPFHPPMRPAKAAVATETPDAVLPEHGPGEAQSAVSETEVSETSAAETVPSPLAGFGPTPDPRRVAHLAGLASPALIVQGERDPFGNRADLAALTDAGLLSPAIGVCFIGDGDHDFGPRGASGFTRQGNLAAAADAVAAFMIANAGTLPRRR